MACQGLRRGSEFLEQRRVGERTGQAPVEPFADEPGTAARDVDEFADQVGINACDKVVEIEVDVLDCLAELRGVVIAEMAGVEVVEIGAGLDKGSA